MQQVTGPPYVSALSKVDPKLLEQVTDLRGYVFSDGALSVKVKTLMSMLCDALLGHADGVRVIADRARTMGASEQEIAETVQVAFLMGGTPALVAGCNAFHE